MWRTGFKQGRVGALAAALWLAGCAEDVADRRRAMTSQNDYYPDLPIRERGTVEPLDTTVEPFATSPTQEEGTGGSEGEVPAGTGASRGVTQATEYAYRLAPPPADIALGLGTGKPLRAGPNGAWVQGIYGVELGAHASEWLAAGAGGPQVQQTQRAGVGTQPQGGTGSLKARRAAPAGRSSQGTPASGQQRGGGESQ